jgi:hypothetical protein
MIKTNNNQNEGSGRGERKKMSPLVSIILGLSLLILLWVIIAPNFLRESCGGQFTQCQSNCKNIGTALEMYSTDHQGHYPPNIPCLSPDYLKSIPTCARAGKDTYSQSYSVCIIGKKNTDLDAYTFFCSGHNHDDLGVSPNYPQYNSRNGLTPK